MEFMDILGVRIDELTRPAVKEKLANFLLGEGQNFLVTPNPEMLVLAHRDPEFRDILNRSSLNMADGVGLLFAAAVLGGKITERVTGVDLVHDLVELANQHQRKIYFLGGLEAWEAERAAESFRKIFPDVSIGTDCGGEIRYTAGQWGIDSQVIEKIKNHAPEVLVVALGHGKQEQFIHDHLTQLPSVKIAIGVGGALDYYAGKVTRAPELWRRLGLEWLWRLFHEPKRFARIFTAVIIFPILIIRSKFR